VSFTPAVATGDNDNSGKFVSVVTDTGCEQPMMPLDVSALVQPIRERVRGNRGRREVGEMDEERKEEGGKEEGKDIIEKGVNW
jgi:hypothetical protein